MMDAIMHTTDSDEPHTTDRNGHKNQTNYGSVHKTTQNSSQADGDQVTVCTPSRNSEGKTEEELPTQPGFCSNLNGRQMMTLLMLCSSKVSSAMYGSLLAPFFPTEAAEKGASSTAVGLIFGCYPLVVFLSSPLFGRYLTKIGSKFMFVSGGFVCSVCAVLFGCLQWSPPGGVYIGLCFATRGVEALASAAASVAACAIAACSFPNHISTVMGFLQASSCLGLVIGPPIGGVLADAGGFYLPFAVTGGVFMVTNLISVAVLPSMQDARHRRGSISGPSNWKLIKIPVVLVVGYLVAAGQAAIGFMDVSLATYLADIQQYAGRPALSPVYVGLIFLIPAAIVVVLAPIYGVLADRKQCLARPFMLLGGILGAIGFLFMGPAPFISFLKPSIKLVIVSLAGSAVGWGGLVVTYQEFVIAARKQGFPEGLTTQGIISGINSSFNSLGAFIGPTIGGILLDHLKFPWSSTIIAALVALAVVFLSLLIVMNACCPQSSPEELLSPSEADPLLDNSP